MQVTTAVSTLVMTQQVFGDLLFGVRACVRASLSECVLACVAGAAVRAVVQYVFLRLQ